MGVIAKLPDYDDLIADVIAEEEAELGHRLTDEERTSDMLETPIGIILRKVNELVDAVNALQGHDEA